MIWPFKRKPEPELDKSKPDPMPYVSACGCRFPDPEVRDGNFEHAGLNYEPRWRT